MINLECIYPLKQVDEPLPKKWWVFDSETSTLYGKPLVICAISSTGERQRWVGDDCNKQFVKWLYDNKRRLRGAWFFAHNLEFDLGKIFGQILKRRDFTVLMADSRLITASLIAYHDKKSGKSKKITFVDTFNLCPTSLESIGESMGFPKGVTPQKFIDGCVAEDITEEDVEYCFRDCEVLMEFIGFYADILAEFGTKMRVTTPANSKAMWNRVCVKKNIWIDKDNDERFREAYYGGRVEVYIDSVVEGPIYHYDINSQYPSVMLNNKFTNPSKLVHIKNPKNWEKRLKKFEGMMDVTVKAPDNIHIPILPVRTTKLIFPVGTFRGKWCFPEIRYALENGYEIVKCHSITCSHPIKSPFTDYIRYFMEMKIKATEDEDYMRRELSKRFMNALSGKFGQRVPVMEDRFHTETAMRKALEEHEMPGNMGFTTYGGMIQLRNVPKERAHGTVVSWIAYITSMSRVLLHKYMNDKTLYCDTDSIFTTEPLPDDQIDESEFGKMALEHVLNKACFIDPKKYAIEYEDHTEFICKGIPKKILARAHENIEDFNKDTLSFVYKNGMRLKTALYKKQAPMSEQDVKKDVIKHNNPKRTYHEDGTSTPLVYTMPE